MRTYTEVGYASERLVGTLVRHAGKAVKVNVIDITGATDITYLSAGRREITTLAKLDITPVPLGFCNFQGQAVYLSRSPVRQDWKQGLRPKTLRVSGEFFRSEDINFKAIGKTVDNEYPTFKDTVEHLNKKGGDIHALAWCREFSLDIEMNIYYKVFGRVGTILDVKDRRFTLDAQYGWVMEALEEALNG